VKLIAAFLTVLGLIAIPAGRTVLRWSRAAPHWRPGIVVASVVVLGLVGVQVPGIGDLNPPWSESPSGLLVIMGRVLVLGLLAAVALAAVVAVGVSLRQEH
jgi:protein-S-isoprenylcysteine O-methyltransferase Ste14